MCSIAGRTWDLRARRKNLADLSTQGVQPAFDADVYRILRAISRIIPSSTGMICAPLRSLIRPSVLSMNENVRYWVATAPVGAASVLAEELAQFGADRHSRAQPRCEVPGHARGRISSLSVVAHRDASVVELGAIDATSCQERLRSGKAHRLARTSRARRHLGVRLQRRQRIHPAHHLRLAAAEGRGLRQFARVDRRAAEYQAGAPRCAAALACGRPYGVGVGGLLRRESAPARLSQRGRPRAAQGKRRGRGAAARGLAADRRGRGACCSTPCAAPARFSPKAR